MYQLKWFFKRTIFLRRIFFELIDRVVYQKESCFLLQNWSRRDSLYHALLFYNITGRTLFAIREYLALLLNGKIFKKSILIEGFDTSVEALSASYIKGSYTILWPKPPMVSTKKSKVDKSFYKKIDRSLALAYKLDIDGFDKTKEWERVSTFIRENFLDENGSTKIDMVENFRADLDIYRELFNDQFSYIDKDVDYKRSYLESIDIVLEYHRVAKRVDRAILSSISESSAGNNLTFQYRGKRLSEKIIFHSIVVSDILKVIRFSHRQRSVILDIGSSYGALSRILKYYTPNSCHILLDLPETLILTSYFIKYNFPDAKIALLDDIEDSLDSFSRLSDEYDFIIIPPAILNYIDSKTVDLVINSASMAFMQESYLNFYLESIDRVLRDGGYFYSLNREYSSRWGIGFFEWSFKGEYITLLHENNNRFSYPQWLGQKGVKR